MKNSIFVIIVIIIVIISGNDAFLFESGRRCTTGPGIFAFNCRNAATLHDVFMEKLRLDSINNSE